LKIVSRKFDTTNCERVRVGKSYKLSIYNEYDINPHAQNIADIHEVDFDDSTIICHEEDSSIWVLSFARNLKGVFIVK
jgi:hypothetical protein